MTIGGMRNVLAERYSGVIRGQRVDRMPDAQVVAIYRSMVNREGRVNNGPGVPKRSRLHEPERCEQIRMDFMYDQTA